MVTTTLSLLEERVAALETEMERLKQERSAAPAPPIAPASTEEMPWWERIFGTFKDDPMFEEAMRLGEEWRRSQQPDFDAPPGTNVSA